MSQPIVYDLYCGLGGWTEGFLAEGYRCIGFDIEAHDYGTGGYPGELRLRDVRSIHGSELKDAAVIVASPPCQAYSYRAMPWKRAKALPPPDNTLFNECFRIQREANEANRVANWDHPFLKKGDCLDCGGTGNFYGNDEDGDYLPCDTCGGWSQRDKKPYIPLIVENVRGAQKWVGRAWWNYGSFYLWGDVPALMPMTMRAVKWGDCNGKRFDERPKGNVVAHREGSGRKVSTAGHWTNPAERELYRDRNSQGVKQHGSGHAWYRTGNGALPSSSPRRKAASAMIAKIPFPLALHIARAYKPEGA